MLRAFQNDLGTTKSNIGIHRRTFSAGNHMFNLKVHSTWQSFVSDCVEFHINLKIK